MNIIILLFIPLLIFLCVDPNLQFFRIFLQILKNFNVSCKADLQARKSFYFFIICQSQFVFSYLGTGSTRCFYSWAASPVSCDSLYPPVCLTSFGDSSLPCGFNSLMNLRKVLNLFNFFSCKDSSDDLKLFTCRIGNQKSN